MVTQHEAVGFQSLNDVALLDQLEICRQQLAKWRRSEDDAKAEIIRRAQANHASGIASDVYDCTITHADSYSQAGFAPLLEIFTEMELRTCMIPAHDEVKHVADEWITNKVKPIAKLHGADALRILESARVPGAPVVKFAAKAPRRIGAGG